MLEGFLGGRVEHPVKINKVENSKVFMRGKIRVTARGVWNNNLHFSPTGPIPCSLAFVSKALGTDRAIVPGTLSATITAVP
jgi:hypothetical protein